MVTHSIIAERGRTMATSNLFNMFGRQSVTPPNNGFFNLVNQFNQFKKNFSGDAQQQVQQMLNSGQMSQQQFNQLSQMATQFQNMMRGH